MKIQFSQDDIYNINKIANRYPDKKSALMPVLKFAQKKFGWISDDVIAIIAEGLNIDYSDVKGVATFYTMYFKKPMAKYHIQVCTNVSCMLRQGEEIFNYISEKLNIKNYEKTPDGLFSLEEVECMGACGAAPMIAINDEYYENISIKLIDELIEKCKNS